MLQTSERKLFAARDMNSGVMLRRSIVIVAWNLQKRLWILVRKLNVPKSLFCVQNDAGHDYHFTQNFITPLYAQNGDVVN